MKFPAILVACAGILTALSCSAPNYPAIPIAPKSGGYPFILRSYDTVAGGVQLTGIAYQEDSNAHAGHPHDEWVVMSSLNYPYVYAVHGWMLGSASMGQRYPLPDTINHIVYMYTHGVESDNTTTVHYMALDSSTWLWRNDHDTARLYDQYGNLVSQLGY